MDLTGLLPTPAEVLNFENDRSPDAYKKVVDRLMASPQYAEQRTMHWLDAVRYADTCGFHGDNVFPAWPYRDYVLRAFRDNKPFDEFTREQLAGDLMPDATLDQKVASAYNRLNRTSAEGGLQPEEYLAKYGADRVRTVSAVWLGSTMGCAECHDHKFDPILTKDFYSMKAFFADVEETGLMPDRGPEAWGKLLSLPTPEQKEMTASLASKIAKTQQELEGKQKQIPTDGEWEKALLAKWQSGELRWRFQHPEAARSINGAKLTIYNDKPVENNLLYIDNKMISDPRPGNGLVVASGPNPDNETYIVTIKPGQGTWTALGVDVQQDESLPGNHMARGADRFVLTGVEATLEEPNRAPRPLAFSLATGDANTQNGMPAMAVLDGNSNTGWGVALGESSDPFLSLRFAEKITTGSDARLVVKLKHESADYRRAVIGRFRLALSQAEYSWPAEGRAVKRLAKTEEELLPFFGGLPRNVVELLKTRYEPKPSPAEPAKLTEEDKKKAAEKTEQQEKALLSYRAWISPELSPLRIRLDTLEAQQNLLEASIARVVTAVAVTPRETRILPRGNWMDHSAPVVEPAIPEKFGKLNTEGRRANRLDLANWIVSPGNPLDGSRGSEPHVARIFRNRNL